MDFREWGFRPIPVPQRSAAANLSQMAGYQASAINANFDLFTPFAAGYAPRSKTVVSRQRSDKTAGFVNKSHLYKYLGDDIWPWFWLTVPVCAGILVTISAMLKNPGPTQTIWLGAVVIGTGVKAQTGAETAHALDYRMAAGGSCFIPADQLVTGQPLQVWPCYACDITTDNYVIQAGEINVVIVG